MDELERQTRNYLQALQQVGPSVDVATIKNLDEILKFARSKGWIDGEAGDGHTLSEAGLREVINA